MGSARAVVSAASWAELAKYCSGFAPDLVNGPTSAQSRLRLFGQAPESVRVILYRDNHAWCPYCQTIWLFLEEKQIPYKVDKVTMFCYGKTELWYEKKVPSGMLPAIELDGQIVTESDDILGALEGSFGPLGVSWNDILSLRLLERRLFCSWLHWLCSPVTSVAQDAQNGEEFAKVLRDVDEALTARPGPFFFEKLSVADCVFIPYVERMLASLYYYKGFDIKTASPALERWFAGLEQRDTYRGTQSDLLTHVHDLPPQMGGCYHSNSNAQKELRAHIDKRPWEVPDVCCGEPNGACVEAVAQVVKHKDKIIAVNPVKNKAVVDEALRAALTTIVSGVPCAAPEHDGDLALRYLRDRLSVPRDMSLWAGRRFRSACEASAALAGSRQPPKIALEDRMDSNPARFHSAMGRSGSDQPKRVSSDRSDHSKGLIRSWARWVLV